MKKLTGILLALALILAPLSASALEMMSDSNMKDVTGQAGVSIALDDVVLFQDVGKTTYTDVDGLEAQYTGSALDTTNDAAAVSISGQKTLTFINAIGAAALGTATNRYSTNYDYVNATPSTADDFNEVVSFSNTGILGEGWNTEVVDNLGNELQGLTIDVATCKLLTAAYQHNGNSGKIAGVVIGLPNLEIVSSSSDKNITVSAEDASGTAAANEGMTFITISEEASTTAILDGYVEIAPH